MDNNIIGKNILNLRKGRGVTQAELAMLVGVSPQAVSKWENSDSVPDIEMIVILARTFNVSIDYLILGKEHESKVSEKTCNIDNNIKEENADEGQVKERAEDRETAKGKEDTNESSPKDEVKMLREELGRHKTIRWSSMMMPIFVSLVGLAIIITGFVLAYPEMCKELGDIPAFSTTLVVTLVSVLLFSNYVVMKTAMRYRTFLGRENIPHYPKNAGGFIAGGFKKMMLWIGRYFIAVKLLYDENKVLLERTKDVAAQLDAVNHI